MSKPRIRHIAINVQDRDKVANYLKSVFGMEEKERGGNGTIYLSDGFVDVALISSTKHKWDQPFWISSGERQSDRAANWNRCDSEHGRSSRRVSASRP
ncbi:MAG: hypothetical protein WD688_02145 [Candidatus Binatia bacterium]